MYQSTPYYIYIAGIVFGIGFGIINVFIARSKNRNPIGYFFLGFFLGIIGLIVAAVIPKLEPAGYQAAYAQGYGVPPAAGTYPQPGLSPQQIPSLANKWNGVRTLYLDQSGTEPALRKGRLYMFENGLKFAFDDPITDIEIPYSDIKRAVIRDNKTLPKDFPLRRKMLSAGSRVVLRIDYEPGEEEWSYYFSGGKAVVPKINSEILQPVLLSVHGYQPQQATYQQGTQVSNAPPGGQVYACPYCGSFVSYGDKKCTHCGNEFGEWPAQE